MKIPLKLKCTKCETQARVRIHLNATSFDWKCPNCGLDHPSFFETNVTMGYLILERSRDEYFEQDYSMSIVLAAMAFECELSRLFGKWRKIDTEMTGSTFDQKNCEQELRDLRTINQRIDAVSALLVSKTMDEYVETTQQFREVIEQRFSSLNIGSLPKDFQEALFWPRNNVLHWGDTSHTEQDAARCFTIAQMGLSILTSMNRERKKALS